MLEEPSVGHDAIARCLSDHYQLTAQEIVFLPLGADTNTAVYRIATKHNEVYFLKLRSGEFSEASVAVPKYLSSVGMKEIIPPLSTGTGQLTANLPPYRLILQPYVTGHNAIKRKLTEQQWLEFGSALKRLHTTTFPAVSAANTPREEYSPRWRDETRMFLERVRQETYREPMAVQMAAFLREKSAEVLELIRTAERLALRMVPAQPGDYVLCHGDIHGANLFIADSGQLYMVDWDTLIFAPKERDLMFIGAGIVDTGYSPHEEERLFYRGYGQTQVNRAAIAYYRYERIVEDLAAYSEQIFLTDQGKEDREKALRSVRANFLPGSTIERAREAYSLLHSLPPNEPEE